MAESGTGGGEVLTGIRGTVTNLPAGATAVIQRKKGVGGTWKDILQLSSNGTWQDELPLDGEDYFYQVRAEKAGHIESSYAASSPASGKPTELGPQ